MSVCLQMCACVCVGSRSSVGDEKVGVNINNEELKCQRRSEGCEMGRTVCVCGGGTFSSCTWGDNNSVQHLTDTFLSTDTSLIRNIGGALWRRMTLDLFGLSSVIHPEPLSPSDKL